MALLAEPKARPASNYKSLIASGELLPLSQYDKIIVSFSGGKDSLALALNLLELGVEKSRIEFWHQHIDGEPGTQGLMDWPCTESYVRAVSKALGVTLRFQWKDGGFEGEMLREEAPTSGVYFEDGLGRICYAPPAPPAKYCRSCRAYFLNGETHCSQCGELRYGLGTRLKFPMIGKDMSRRWCSAYLKIDVAKRAIANDHRFDRAKILFLTGERRQESDARLFYDERVPHGSNSRSRRVDQWRMVIDWHERDVWEIIRDYGIIVHPAYFLGWSRVSCLACIYGDQHQWASIRRIAEDRFNRILAYERQFGVSIKQGETVEDQANRGLSYVDDAPAWLIKLAMSPDYPTDRVILKPGEEWLLPAGAYKRCGGPT